MACAVLIRCAEPGEGGGGGGGGGCLVMQCYHL